jgi:hypothetical protein
MGDGMYAVEVLYVDEPWMQDWKTKAYCSTIEEARKEAERYERNYHVEIRCVETGVYFSTKEPRK